MGGVKFYVWAQILPRDSLRIPIPIGHRWFSCPPWTCVAKGTTAKGWRWHCYTIGHSRLISLGLRYTKHIPREMFIPTKQYGQGGIHLHLAGWWFQTWLLFSIIYGIILPIDELIFFKMVKATNQLGLGGAIWCNGVCSLALTGRSVQMWVLKPRVREFGCCDDFHGGWEHRFGLCFHVFFK